MKVFKKMEIVYRSKTERKTFPSSFFMNFLIPEKENKNILSQVSFVFISLSLKR